VNWVLAQHQRYLGPTSVSTSLGSDHVDGPISLESCADPKEVGTNARAITFGSKRWTHYIWVWTMDPLHAGLDDGTWTWQATKSRGTWTWQQPSLGYTGLGKQPSPVYLDLDQVQGTWQVCRPRRAILQPARVGLHPPLGYAALACGPAEPLSWVCSQAHEPVPSPRSLASGVCIQVLIFFNLKKNYGFSLMTIIIFLKNLLMMITTIIIVILIFNFTLQIKSIFAFQYL